MNPLPVSIKSAIHKSTDPEKNALVSMPAPETLEREKDKLWVKDSELIRRMGVPEPQAREALRMLDSTVSGFPKKQKLWGDRRYWPAVKAYFDAQYGVKVDDRRQRS